MDSRSQDRWHAGGIRSYSPCRYKPVPHPTATGRRFDGNAERHSANRFRMWRTQRFECGVLNGKVSPGDTLTIVGAGPVGLAALLTAQFYSPGRIISIDLDENRLAVARKFGATDTVNSGTGDAAKRIMALTDGRGGGTAVEAE